MPVTAVRTAVPAGRVRPSVPKLCVQSAHWYAFFQAIFQPAIREPMLPSNLHPGPLRPRCAQDLFAIMHRISRSTSSASSTGCVGQAARTASGRGADPGSRHSAGVSVSRAVIPSPAREAHRTVRLVLRTRLQARPTSSRSSSRCPAPSASTLCPSSITGSDGQTSQSTRQRRRGPWSQATAHGTRSRRQLGCWDDVVDRVRCARRE
jgi:hypothetical protein